MASATFDTITIAQVVAQTKLELGLFNSTAEDSLIKRLTIQCLKGLRTPMTIIRKQAFLTSEDGTFELPSDFISMTAQNSIKVINGAQGMAGTSPIPSMNPFFDKTSMDSPNNNVFYLSSMFQIVGNKIYFSPNINVTEIAIAYNGVNTDEEGLPVIPADYERMLVAYNRWKFYTAFFREYPANLRAETYAEYRQQKREFKGKDNLLTDADRQVLTNYMNQLAAI